MSFAHFLIRIIDLKEIIPYIKRVYEKKCGINETIENKIISICWVRSIFGGNL